MRRILAAGIIASIGVYALVIGGSLLLSKHMKNRVHEHLMHQEATYGTMHAAQYARDMWRTFCTGVNAPVFYSGECVAIKEFLESPAPEHARAGPSELEVLTSEH